MSQEKQNEKTVPTGENEASIGLSGSAPVKEEGTTNKSPLAVNSAAEIPDWKRIGWKRVSESIEAGPQKNFDYEEILKELYYNDLWSYSGVVFFSLFSTWFIVLCGGGIGWIFVLCAFIATYLKSSMARFYRNAKSDIGREIAKGKLEVDDEKVEWLNEFLRRFWLIYEPVLSASIIQIADTVLGASTPSFLDSIKLTNFTLGTKPPSIETIRSYPKEDDDTVIMDWKISFVPNDLAEMTKAQLVKKVNPKVILTIRVGRGFVGAGMPILLEDVSFTGLLRVKLKLIPNYPHVETTSLTFLEEPIIDYVLKPIGGETLGFDIKNIPGLQPFIKDQVHAVLRPMMYSPNVYTLVTEHLLYGYPIESAIGVLKLNIKSAKNLRNAETFGTSDPYCKVVLLTSDITVVGKELSRTKYIDNSLSPVWNETFYLLFNNLKDSLKFQIYDSNGKMSSDTLLGDNTFPLQKFVENPNQPNITIPVMHDKKQKGELYFDAVWYPIVETKRDEPVPESNIGILKFNLHQAKELDPRFSMVGVYNPYAELKYNGKEVFRSRTFRRSNNPIWEEFFEIYMTNRKDARLELSIRDERDFAEDPIVGSWSMSADELRESKIDWFDLKNARSGKVRLSCQWKPIILDHIPDNSGYAEPLGVIKLHIKKATDLKNVAQLRGKSDPYIRIVLNSIYRGRTNMRNNNLNPIWDEYFYIPVHSLEGKLCLYCFDYENYGKDRNLGFTELIVNDLIKKSDDGKILSDESIDITAPFKDGKGSLFYSASFHPILEIEKEENKENDIKVLEHQSGILVININHTKFKKKTTFIEFFVDNSSFPVYDTDMYEDEDTGIFIKDLNSSKIILNIKQKDSKSIGKVEFNVKESLKKCLNDDESIWLPVEGMNNFSLNIKLNYIPVKYNDKLDKNNKSDEYDKLGENEKLDENNKPDEDDYYKPDENINNVKHPHVEILNKKGHAAASAITDGVSKFGSRLGISKKKDKDENKKGDEKKEVTEKVLIPDKSNKNEVVPKPEEIKPINAKQEENKKEPILSNNAKQEENKEEYILQNPPEKPEKPVNHVEENEEEKQKKSKQLKEANNEIKPYNIDLENDNPKQKEENNTLTRHVEFDSEIPIISRKQDEGSRSSEENGNKPNRLSSHSMNQSGEIVGEPGTLTITVIEAKNLIAASGGGTTSNSYVKVKVNGKKEILKTSVVKKSTSPKWNEHTRFEITGSPISFLFCVRDRNLLSKDIDLGEYTLNLWEHISIDEYIKDMWIPLSKGTNSQLHLKLDFVPSAQNSSSEKVNETNKANSRNGTMLRRTSISHGKSSGEVNDSSKFE